MVLLCYALLDSLQWLGFAASRTECGEQREKFRAPESEESMLELSNIRKGDWAFEALRLRLILRSVSIWHLGIKKLRKEGITKTSNLGNLRACQGSASGSQSWKKYPQHPVKKLKYVEIKELDFGCTTMPFPQYRHLKLQVSSSAWPLGPRKMRNKWEQISILKRTQVIYSCRMIWESYTSQLSSSCIICNEAGHVHAAYRCAREVVEKVWRPKALQNQRYHDTRLLYFCRKAGVEHSAGNNALPSQWNGMELGGVVRQVSSPQKKHGMYSSAMPLAG